jgi:hypothetical protein
MAQLLEGQAGNKAGIIMLVIEESVIDLFTHCFGLYQSHVVIFGTS